MTKNKKELALTKEQELIIASTGDIKINAVAGSGKTTTVIQYAASRPVGSKMLYLAFNKSVRLEAKQRFAALGLKNVQVETAHSLAYKYIVPSKGYRVSQQGYKTHEIAELLGLKGSGEKHEEFILANHISKFIAYFCNSNASKVQDLDYRVLVSDEKAKLFVNSFYKYIEQGTRQFLAKMNAGEIEITHDFYLKLFQLAKPRLPFDYILFDEGQDASPAMLDIFLHQSATKVIVGDTHQQIYAWRHAVNSLSKVEVPAFQLSASFRFPPAIANLGREILNWKKHLQSFTPVVISGEGKPSTIKTKATIARTNLGLLLSAINFISDNKNVKHLYFEGNINSYTYADDGASLYDVLNLYNNKKDRIRDKLIAAMRDMEELEDYIEKTEDVQLGMMLQIVEEYGNEIPSLIKSLKDKHVEDDNKEKAQMIFSTVHRSKGMEYDSVELVNDFVTEDKILRAKFENKAVDPLDIARWNEEINLLYVAITRAKSQLRIPEGLVPKGFPASPYIQVLKMDKYTSVEKFESAFTDPAKRINKKSSKGKKESAKQQPSYSQQRLSQKNTLTRWSVDQDNDLRDLFEKGMEIKELASYFDKKESMIANRLRKLGYYAAD